MAKGILGRKIGMTQIFTEEGKLIPVTVTIWCRHRNQIIIYTK